MTNLVASVRVLRRKEPEEQTGLAMRGVWQKTSIVLANIEWYLGNALAINKECYNQLIAFNCQLRDSRFDCSLRN